MKRLKRKHLILIASSTVVALPLVGVSAYGGITSLNAGNNALSTEERSVILRSIENLNQTQNFRVEFNPGSIPGVNSPSDITNDDLRLTLNSFTLRSNLQPNSPALNDFRFQLVSLQAIGDQSVIVTYEIRTNDEMQSRNVSRRFTTRIDNFQLNDEDFIDRIVANKVQIRFNTPDGKPPTNKGVDDIAVDDLEVPQSTRNEVYTLRIASRNADNLTITVEVNVALDNIQKSYQVVLGGIFSNNQATINAFFSNPDNLPEANLRTDNPQDFLKNETLTSTIVDLINNGEAISEVNKYFQLANASQSIPLEDGTTRDVFYQLEGVLNASLDGSITLFANAYSEPNGGGEKISVEPIAFRPITGFLNIRNLISVNFNNFVRLTQLFQRIFQATMQNPLGFRLTSLINENNFPGIEQVRSSYSAQTFLDRLDVLYSQLGMNLERIRDDVREKISDIKRIRDSASPGFSLSVADSELLDYWNNPRNVDLILSYQFNPNKLRSQIDAQNRLVNVSVDLTSSLDESNNPNPNMANFNLPIAGFLTPANEEFLRVFNAYNSGQRSPISINYQSTVFDNTSNIPSEFIEQFLKNNLPNANVNEQIIKLRQAFTVTPANGSIGVGFQYRIVPIYLDDNNNFTEIDSPNATKQEALLHDDNSGTVTFWVQIFKDNESFAKPFVVTRQVFQSTVQRDNNTINRIINAKLAPEYISVQEGSTNGSTKTKAETSANEVTIANLHFTQEQLREIGALDNGAILRVVSLEAPDNSMVTGILNGVVRVSLRNGDPRTYNFQISGFASERESNLLNINQESQNLDSATLVPGSQNILASSLLTTQFRLSPPDDATVDYEIIRIQDVDDIRGTLQLLIKASKGAGEALVEKTIIQNITGLETVESSLNRQIDNDLIKLNLNQQGLFLPSDLASFGNNDDASGFRDRLNLFVPNRPANYRLQYVLDGTYNNAVRADDDSGNVFVRMHLEANVDGTIVRSKSFTLTIGTREGLISNETLARRALDQLLSNDSSDFLKIVDENNNSIQPQDITPDALTPSLFAPILPIIVTNNGVQHSVSFTVSSIMSFDLIRGVADIAVRATLGSTSTSSNANFVGLLNNQGAVTRAFDKKEAPIYFAPGVDISQILVVNLDPSLIQFTSQNNPDFGVEIPSDGKSFIDKNRVNHMIISIVQGVEERRSGTVTVSIRISKGASIRIYSVVIEGFKKDPDA